MAESSWPTVANSHRIDDVQWEQMTTGFVSDGLIGTAADTPVAYADSSGMQIKIRANKLGLVRGHGWTSGSTEFVKSISANASGSTRVDLVVLRFTRSTQDVVLVVKTGTPGAGAPALTQDPIASGTGVWEVALATVTVASGITAVAAASVVSIAKYVKSGATGGKSKLYRISPPDPLTGGWINTGPPTADNYDAVGMFQNARLIIDKQSPDTDLEIEIRASGFASSAAGRVTFGVRVMASGYTSSNHVVGSHFFNLPVAYGSSESAGFWTSSAALSGHPNHAHNVYPYTHNHATTVGPIHMAMGGYLRIPSLAVNTYTVQVWFYTQGQTFSMDFNDQLMFRLAEV